MNKWYVYYFCSKKVRYMNMKNKYNKYFIFNNNKK